jgi:class 3 adenylate cyclase
MKHMNFVHKHPILTIAALSVLGIAAVLGNMVYLSNSINRELALKYADSYLVALNTFHSMYSTEVVSRLKDSGITVSANYKEIPGAIPVPATLSIELASKISQAENGVTTRLYSNFPFSSRKNGGPKDEYERQALNFFQFATDKNQAFIRYEEVNGQPTLRYAKALIMKQSCVDCHNSHPDSTKKDWKVGDVRGARVVNIPLNRAHDLAREGWLMTLIDMIAIVAIGIALIYLIIQALRSSIRMLSLTNSAYDRFVPHEFLSYLNKQSIVDVQLNDNVEKRMTILFSDIRSFTSLSEGMTPKQNFQFINNYLRQMGPIIRHNHGFIDKYIGDAIMALFNNTDDAINAALQMLEALDEYNKINISSLPHDLSIGIGIHRGKLRLGTVGEDDRMDSTVIGDAVNLASRIESTTKLFGSQCLISDSAMHDIENAERLDLRLIGEVTVKGKARPVTLYEVFNGNAGELKALKQATREKFEQAVNLFQLGSFDKAQVLFAQCVEQSPADTAALYYLNLCQNSG